MDSFFVYGAIFRTFFVELHSHILVYVVIFARDLRLGLGPGVTLYFIFILKI
jgi:hypothetical protein